MNNKLQIDNKDITQETSGLIVHGCNAQGVMGSGVALAIRNKWPKVYQFYHFMNDYVLGDVQFVQVDDDLYVANLISQEFFGSDNKRYASLDAIETGLIKCFIFCMDNNLILKMPKIGALRGGLSWELEVEPMVLNLMDQFPDVEVQIIDLA